MQLGKQHVHLLPPSQPEPMEQQHGWEANRGLQPHWGQQIWFPETNISWCLLKLHYTPCLISDVTSQRSCNFCKCFKYFNSPSDSSVNRTDNCQKSYFFFSLCTYEIRNNRLEVGTFANLLKIVMMGKAEALCFPILYRAVPCDWCNVNVLLSFMSPCLM